MCCISKYLKIVASICCKEEEKLAKGDTHHSSSYTHLVRANNFYRFFPLTGAVPSCRHTGEASSSTAMSMMMRCETRFDVNRRWWCRSHCDTVQTTLYGSSQKRKCFYLKTYTATTAISKKMNRQGRK